MGSNGDNMKTYQRPRHRRNWPSIAGSAEQRASRGLTRLEDLTRLISEWAWETDTRGDVTYVSDRVNEVLGYIPIQLVGKNFAEIGSFMTETGDELSTEWQKPFRDTMFKTQDSSGSEKLFLISGIPFFCPETGRYEGFSGTAEDITERANSENALIQAQNELETRVVERTQALELSMANTEQANQAKSEFLASMSHELRTPMNAILGFAQMLKYSVTDPLSAKQGEYIDDIVSGGEHLLELIGGILDLAKIEADQVSLSENCPSSYKLEHRAV
jgi:PAS domain S-box-containing protein